MIQPINYTLFILILVGSSIVRYRVGVNNIYQKLRIQQLNNALEEIANHDSLTRLKNRHALSCLIPTYTGREICIAMLDINKFKYFTDTFGHLHPDQVTYSWWSYRFRAREKNAGWRIDYFLISNRLQKQLDAADIHTDIFGSDHCPVELVIRTES